VKRIVLTVGLATILSFGFALRACLDGNRRDAIDGSVLGVIASVLLVGVTMRAISESKRNQLRRLKEENPIPRR
jgi:hypothetical protein